MLVNKITSKDILGMAKIKIDEILDKKDNEKDLYIIMGYVKTAVEKESQYGPFMEFKGSFKAKNLMDGKELIAGKMFMPPVVANIIAGVHTEGSETSFAFKVGIKRADTTVGYEYYASPLIPQEASDPIALLESKITM